MGCGGSKSVAVRQPVDLDHAHPAHSTASVNDQTEVNIFVDPKNDFSDDDDDRSQLLCDNAKPRLARSGIRRTTIESIKPVTNESNKTPRFEDRSEYSVISSSNSYNNNHTNLLAEYSRSSDSGLGNTSVVSDNTERIKSSTANTPHKPQRSRTPSFVLKLPEHTNRPDSGKTGSILTTSALNASFMTTGDDDFSSYNVDVSLDLQTPFSEYADAEESTFRTLSITPSVPSTSVEPTPVMHPKHIGVIHEESEGGFTPRSIDFAEDGRMSSRVPKGAVPTYLPKEFLSHNKQVDKNQWVLYKRKLFDKHRIISIFSPIVKEYVKSKCAEREKIRKKFREELEAKGQGREEKTANHLNDHSDDSSDDFSDDSEDEFYAPLLDSEEYELLEDCIYNGEQFEAQDAWSTDGLDVLIRINLGDDIINQHLPSCCVGELVQPNCPRYWDDVRCDIRMVLDNLNRADALDALTANQTELKEQLQAWMSQYHSHNPQIPMKPQGDPNQSGFPLPSRIQGNPDLLRQWVPQWVEFDLEVPVDGAWSLKYEVEEIYLGDPDAIFKASLRPDNERSNSMCLDIDGEAAWQVLAENLIADDIMTSSQEAVEISRRHRTDLNDPKRMERRRKALLKYFILKYELKESYAHHFTQWANAMEEGDRKLKELCDIA